ncbi:MAG: hypothetical protein ACP5GX_11940 [Anaerolineae bacterium]
MGLGVKVAVAAEVGVTVGDTVDVGEWEVPVGTAAWGDNAEQAATRSINSKQNRLFIT